MISLICIFAQIKSIIMLALTIDQNAYIRCGNCVNIYHTRILTQNEPKSHILVGMALAIPKFSFSKYADKNDLKATKII